MSRPPCEKEATPCSVSRPAASQPTGSCPSSAGCTRRRPTASSARPRRRSPSISTEPSRPGRSCSSSSVVDEESDGPLEAVLGCPDDVQPTDVIGIRTEPEHDEAYTTITKAQWAY